MSRKLDKSQLRALFDHVTKQLQGKAVEVEVASLQLGNQVQAEWLALLGLSYNPDDDAVEIMLEGVDVTVSQPREILFDGSGGQWSALNIVDAEGVQHVIELKEPLLLPMD
jgi:acylphosphatase